MPLHFAFRLFKHGSLWAYRLLTFAVLAVGLLFAAVVLLLRYWVLPHIDDYREYIVDGVARAAHQRIQIGRIEGEWDGFRPRLILRDVSLLDNRGQERLKLEKVDSTLAWLSLFAGELRFYSIEFAQLSLEIRRDTAGNLLVAGIPVGQAGGDSGLGDWLLEQHTIVVRDSQLTWIDERLGGTPLELEDVELRVEQLFWSHRFGLRAKPPMEVASPVDIRGDLRGGSLSDPSGWSGRVYLGIGYANLGALRQWFELPMQTSEGSGSVQVWGNLQRGHLREMTADVAMSNVRTRVGDEVPELQLASLRGRLGWRSEPTVLTLWARGLSFTTPDGVHLPPADISYSRTQPGANRALESEVAFDAVELDALTRLIDRLPVDPVLRTRLAEVNPRGRLQGFHVSWRDGFDWSGPYVVRGGFQDVAVSPSGPLPGISHVTGSLEASEQGGSLTLNAVATSLDMPAVLVGPVPLDRLQAKASWTMQAGLPKVVLERVVFSSKDLAGEVSGRYEVVSDGPGIIDLKGNLAQMSGPEAWRYIPRVVGEPVRLWIRRALVSATARDARLTLRGDLRRFPWEQGDGSLELVAAVQDGTLVYAQNWPRVEGLQGQLTIRGSRLEFTGTAGGVFGTRFAGFTGVIPDVGSSNALLEVRGEVEGPTSDFLRYVQESPIRERMGEFTDGMRASGRGRLSLRLDIPLNHSIDGRLSGVYTFADNTLDPGEGLPVLEQFSGQLAFTQDEASLRDGVARVFGAPVRFTAARDGPGSIRILATGRVDAALLRREINQPVLARLTGATDWHLSASLSERRHDFVIESNLLGMTSSLPSPFAKLAQERVPLRIERRERTRGQDLVTLAYGGLLSAQFLMEKTGKTRVRRGEIVLGASAPAPQRDGVWIAGKLERIDLDQWQELLSQPGVGVGPGSTALAGVNLSASQVRAFSRDFHDLQLGATRRDGAWLATLDSREIAGDLKWVPEGDGMVVGRFSRLQLPLPTSELEPEPVTAQPSEGKDLPSVDLTADDFRMGPRQFGKLALIAVPNGADWGIERLDLTNPDGALSLTGLWQAWAVSPRTQVNVKLEVNDIGRFFTRMELPQGIQGGKARLEGPLSWSGPPYALDLPTLSGQLALKASKGRFVKIDPGIGKLLSVVSLQTLPKVVTLDFTDIFSQGFSFEQISAGVDITRGVARTQNFNMEGSAARVEMKGDVNLAAETQQLDVRIFPAMSDSVALGTAFVNPAIGLGAWVLQKALKDPLGQILSFEYHVAGTWTAPTVTKKKQEHQQRAPAGRR